MLSHIIVLLLSVCVYVWSGSAQRTCKCPPPCTNLHMSVNGHLVDNQDVYLPDSPLSPLTIECQFDITQKPEPPTLFKISSDNVPTQLKVNYITIDSRPALTYNVPAEDRIGRTAYQCQSSSSNTCFQITVSYVDRTDPPSTDPPSITPSTGSNFTGLNPLIYTISAVILLGSLAIVAIITCWIRARRSFNNRSLRSAQTAQDYFDFLSDNEFTPLTSEEFQASLQERPPTYTQSEQIESQDSRPEEMARPSQSEPEPGSSVPPEEAAIIENLIALNLLPEDSRPPPRQNRLRRVRVESQQQPAPPTPPPPVEQDEGREAVEHLRSVGYRAQQLLTEQRSTGELISLDTPDEQVAESAHVSTDHMTLLSEERGGHMVTD